MDNTTLRRDFLKYVSLNVFGMIGFSCYILADTYFISARLGASGLAALNYALPAYCFLSSMGLMLGMGGGSRFSIQKAQGDTAAARRTFTHTLLLGAGISLCFLLCGLFFSAEIAALLGAKGDILPLGQQYLQVILCLSPFHVLNNILIAFLRNDGAPRRTMIAMLTGSASNIVLDWVFMYPLGLGMFGAAFATCLAPVVSSLILLPLLLGKHPLLRPTSKGISPKEFPRIVSGGLSAMITELSSGTVLLVFNLVIFRLSGDLGVAAYGIVANLALVSVAVFTGIAQGIQPLASALHGKGDDPRRVLRPALLCAAALAVGIYVFSVLCSDPLIAVFDTAGTPPLRSLAKTGILLYFIGFLPAGLNIVRAAFLSATEKAPQGFLLSFGRGFLFLLPTVLLLSFHMTGVWLAFPIAEVCTLLFSFFLCRQKRNK